MDDHQQQQYQLRCLTEVDIIPWTQFCASCFSCKTNPPPASYFARHYHNDPRRDCSLIQVIDYSPVEVQEDGAKSVTPAATAANAKTCKPATDSIASSARIFQRTISTGSKNVYLEAGGIGEVCTSEQHRKKGLVKRLLGHAIETMNTRKMNCSLLHASAALTPVYEKCGGYTCVTSKWKLITLDKKGLEDVSNDSSSSSMQIRLAQFPNDTEKLQQLHQRYSEERFAGCIIRSIEYWNEYIQYEIGDSLYVLTNNGTIIGWISIRLRNGKFQLREFGVDLELQSITTAQMFSKLMKVALKQYIDDYDKVELHLPTAIVQEMKDQHGFDESNCPWIDWSFDIRDNDDIGWMYKMLDSSNDNLNIIDFVQNQNVPHLIWPSDSL